MKAVRDTKAKKRRLPSSQVIIKRPNELICNFLPDFSLTYVNQTLAEYFEKTPEELLENSFLDFFICIFFHKKHG